MTVNHLASNYKSILAVPFIIILFGIGMGILPLAEDLDPIEAMGAMLVPILALIASDHMDTYQLFKSGVYKVAAVDFADDRIDRAADIAVKGIETFEQLAGMGGQSQSNQAFAERAISQNNFDMRLPEEDPDIRILETIPVALSQRLVAPEPTPKKELSPEG